ncbi:MAG: HDOD domain-containing protein [Desulfobacterota bacterium]|nr:HDOD domain-containing protein [Thermodesulfobacteriota bacterium]
MNNTTVSYQTALPSDIQAAAHDIPSVSPLLGKIHRMSQEMETSPRDMVKIIMLDPTLTAQVLRLVNSSFYGLAQRVSSLAQAVVLLGMNTVKNIAVSTALLNTMSLLERCSPLRPESFWRHCLGTALACKTLGTGQETAELLFVAGMLHDIGKILFIRLDPDRYGKAIRESRLFGVCLYFAEQALFGCTHMQAGAFLAHAWNFDAPLIEAIEHHHATGSRSAPYVAVANNFCKESSIGDSGNIVVEEHAASVALQLGLRDKLTQQLAASITDEIMQAAAFLCQPQEHSRL